ncbi:MAG: NAD(P)-dependent alcohol dehydrogenase [Polyangiales bacterium]
MEIRAAIARRGEPFRIEPCELGAPAADEVLVAIEAVGLCHTDLTAKEHGLGTPLPAVLGHEGVGRIVELGAGVQGFAIGDRVLLGYGACGTCPSCGNARLAYCRHGLTFNLFGRRLDGSSPVALAGQPITGHFFAQSSFATHAIARTTNLVRLDEDLPPHLMAPLACGLQTGLASVADLLRVGPSDTLGIFGCGAVGFGGLMAAVIAGAKRIVVVDVDPSRLELARALGATHVIDANREPLEAALRDLGGLGLAFDTTGSGKVIEAAFGALRPAGTLVCAGLGKKGDAIAIDPTTLVTSGRTIRGTIEGDANPREFVPRAIAWFRQGKLPIDRIVTTYPFEAIEDAAEAMRTRRAIKPVLLMPQGGRS